jgi:cytochrome c oxidase cbb3-type subunit 2
MPGFPWLFENRLDGAHTPDKMRALRSVGVPYGDDEIAGAAERVRDKREADALVAYLQQLGLLRPAGS